MRLSIKVAKGLCLDAVGVSLVYGILAVVLPLYTAFDHQTQKEFIRGHQDDCLGKTVIAAEPILEDLVYCVVGVIVIFWPFEEDEGRGDGLTF